MHPFEQFTLVWKVASGMLGAMYIMNLVVQLWRHW